VSNCGIALMKPARENRLEPYFPLPALHFQKSFAVVGQFDFPSDRYPAGIYAGNRQTDPPTVIRGDWTG